MDSIYSIQYTFYIKYVHHTVAHIGKRVEVGCLWQALRERKRIYILVYIYIYIYIHIYLGEEYPLAVTAVIYKLAANTG